MEGPKWANFPLASSARKGSFTEQQGSGPADRSRDRPIDRAGFENEATVRVEECEC